MGRGSILEVGGIRVGHWTDERAATGCTVVLFDHGSVGGCMVAGAAPGTRETALLDPTCTVDEVHAVLIGGGSAFGLAAADGVMRYLEERGRGFDVGVARVPIVPAAILFDLAIGDSAIRPGRDEGYAASLGATADRLEEGNVGAGTGATVGKLLGPRAAMKGGLGTSSVRIPGGIVVGAVAAVNCAGNVVDPASGVIVAGTRLPDGAFLDSAAWMTGGGSNEALAGENTTLVVVATNARLTKAEAGRLARLAYQGLARAIRPILPFDGDTVFAVGRKNDGQVADLAMLGAAAAEALVEAILSGVRAAKGLHGYPSASDLAARGSNV